MKKKVVHTLIGLPLCLAIILICSFVLIAISTKNPVISTYYQPKETKLYDYLIKTEITEPNSGLPAVDAVYVINLERRKEKWVQAKQMCEEHGIHPNRLNAVDGRLIPPEAFKALFGYYKQNISAAQVGCMLSHLSTIKDAYDRGFETIWILEDDAEIQGNLQLLFEDLSALKKMVPNWDVFYTNPGLNNIKPTFYGHFLQDRIDPRPDQRMNKLSTYLDRSPLNKHMFKTGLRWGAYSMFISRHGMELILNYFSHVYFWSPYDLDIHYIPTIQEFSSTESIVSTRMDGPHDTVMKGWGWKEVFRGTPRTIRQLWDDYFSSK
jgi:GR25 family glycosyltransferase involved in LPS biosynthesis